MTSVHQDALAAAVSAVLARLDGEAAPPAAALSGSALEALAECFALTAFERDVLVLCAAMEVESSTAQRCHDAGGPPYPTFALCLRVLDGAHWSALTPRGPLRWFKLIELDNDGVITAARLRIAERVLHFLAGAPEPDAALAGLVVACEAPALLPPSHQRLATTLAGALAESTVVSLTGADAQTRREVAAAAAEGCGLGVYAVAADDLPAEPIGRESVARLWEREAVMLPAALLIEVVDASRATTVESFAALLHVPVVISSTDPLAAQFAHRVQLEVPALAQAEQHALWRQSLNGSGEHVDDVALSGLVAQFSLPGHAIRSAAQRAKRSDTDVAGAAWQAGLDHARMALDELGQRLSPRARWEDLVVPDRQRSMLREIVAHVRQRSVVYQQWGFDALLRRGLGVTALFAGASGTGKTLAAEVLAGELGLDLFVIDLSQVVNKYIGETEKNLRRVFDAAERGGAVLLFDEADALFGKRSEVNDSHDRYANLEVSYLLMRMEAYRGLAILTTNQKKALDSAFLRRLRFVVDFPFPDVAERAEIWRRVIPAPVPVADLAYDSLAKLTVAGGSIRNIALSAAFLAADEGAALGMRHVLAAASTEYVKLERSLSPTEVAGWV
jgi:ATPase family associated with various cellular activities (AAA)